MTMKRLSLAAAVVAAVLVLAPSVRAERPERERPSRWGGQQDQGGENGARRAQMIAQRLGLDAATKQRLVELFERQQEERKGIREKLQSEMQKLRQLVRDTAPASALNTQLDTIRGLTRQMAELQGKGIDEVRTILGPEKSARLVLMMQQRMQNMREQVRGRMNEGRGQGGGRRSRGGEDEEND